MNWTKTAGLYLLFTFYTYFLHSQSIFINEFMASNSQTIADETGAFEDWVEIYNASQVPFNIGGKFITDDFTDPFKWQIPDTDAVATTIAPSSYLLLWFDGDTAQGVLHVAPKLKSGGEQIGIFNADGTALDSLTYDAQTKDISFGRVSDGSANFTTFSSPTPRAANAITTAQILDAPVASQMGGLYQNAFRLALTSNMPNAIIYYTTDGQEPTENSRIYTTPIEINTTQVIRAKAFKEEWIPSNTLTNTYLIEENFNFPIVAFSGNPAHFFGEEGGLFPNYEKDIELPINVEFYEPDGTIGFNQVAEVEIHGSTSAIFAQKSLAVKAKRSLGKSTFDYPIFPEETEQEYRSFILRNSGQDWEYTMFRDALQSSFTRDLSDLTIAIESPNLDGQAFRPAIAFINGEYWGIYNLRERLDWRYIKTHYGLDKEAIDLLENLDDAKEGDFEAWNGLDSLLRMKSFSDERSLEELANLVDLDNYRDYIAFNIFIDNTDWPGNNYRRWRERTPDGKWRWMTKDLDFAFGFAEFSTGSFNTGNPAVNSLHRMLNPTFFYPNPDWATLLFEKLMENSIWRKDFINRMADQLNVLYSTERMLQRINDFQALYQPDIPQHNRKWENVWTWEKDIEVLKTFAKGRVKEVQNHFVESISAITGTSEVTLTAVPANGGKIKINTITTDQNNFPWTGTYFNGLEVPIEAIPNPGFVFAGWSENIRETSQITAIQLKENIELIALFVPEANDTSTFKQTIDFPAIQDKLTTAVPFAVTATASSGLPVDFSILFGPAVIFEDTIFLEGSPGQVLVEARQAGNERFEEARPIRRLFDVIEFLPPIREEYCESKGEEPWQEYIANVNLNTLDNTSFKERYGDFTNQSTFLNIGNDYEISLTPGFSWAHYEEEFSVWIDWNQDRDFTGDEEAVFQKTYSNGVNGSTASPVIGSISVPVTAQLGATRMRVIMQRKELAKPCGQFILGETEDYTIEVVDNRANISADNLNFTAFNRGRAVETQWLVNRGLETERFVLERSANGENFELLRNVSVPFINKEVVFFKSIDEQPLVGTNYYRLKQVFTDGSHKLSPIRTVSFRIDLEKVFVFPNPAKDVLQVQFPSFVEKSATIQLFDTYGKLQQELTVDVLPAELFSIPVSELANGLYYLKIQGSQKTIYHQKIVINRFY